MLICHTCEKVDRGMEIRMWPPVPELILITSVKYDRTGWAIKPRCTGHANSLNKFSLRNEKLSLDGSNPQQTFRMKTIEIRVPCTSIKKKVPT